VHGTILLLSLPVALCSQPCRIPYEYNTAEELKKNKVKEVKIFVGEKKGDKPKPVYHYTFNKEGCAERLYHYDNFSIKEGVVLAELVFTDNNTEKIYRKGRITPAGDYKIVFSEREFFSKGGKLIKKINVSDDGIRHIETISYDTLTSKYVIKYSAHIHTPTGDTLYTVFKSNILDKRIYIVRNKKDGKWTETEKSVSKYKDSICVEYTLYRNGVIAQYWVPDENKNKNEEKLEYGDNPSDEFGLPVPDDPIDTIFSDVTGMKSKVDGKNRNNSKYAIALHYTHPDKKYIQYADVYYTKSGLIFMRIMYFNLAMSEVYEYEYY